MKRILCSATCSNSRLRPAVVVLLLCAAATTAQDRPAAAVEGATQTGVEMRRAQFLEMFARAYFPGRTGQILIVPREGDIITSQDPELPYMHGSPWGYDTGIPMLFAGAAIRPGTYAVPARQQDVAVTIAAAFGTTMPPTSTGHVLPVLNPKAPRPRAALLVVLDGMRPDYFDRYAAEMPAFSNLRRGSAWFTHARVNYVPSNTAVGHSTIATGADPRVHGITGNNLYDRVNRKRRDAFEGWRPQDLMALTLADVWQLESAGRAPVIAQGGSVPASTALAGHGACQLNGNPIVMAGYDQVSGLWKTNADCYTLPADMKALNATTLWPADGKWMGHKIDTPAAVRRSGLFPRFEADAFVKLIEAQAFGAEPVLLLLNYKSADYVGHKHGPASPELRSTLAEMDRHFTRILAALEAKVGRDYLLALTADHGMPGEPVDPGRRHYSPDIVDALHAKFDPDRRALITYYEPENAQIFVDAQRLEELKLSLRDLAASLESQPFVFAAFTEDEVRKRSATLR
jgi:type I phosphodiesterase/nucleotide pyrophosphatase